MIRLKGWPKSTHSLVMDDIIRQLAQFTISNLDSPPYVGATIEEVAEALNQLSVSDDLRPPSSPPSRSTHPQSNTQPPEDDLDRLVFLDNQLDSHIQRILSCLDSLADPNPTSQQDIQLDLTKEQKLLRASHRQLGGLETHNEAAVCELAGAMRERLAVFSSAVDFYLEVLRARSLPDVNARIESGSFLFAFYSNHLTLRKLSSLSRPGFATQTQTHTCRHTQCSCSEPLRPRIAVLVQCKPSYAQNFLGGIDGGGRRHSLLSQFETLKGISFRLTLCTPRSAH